jgi:hypothetical protein
MLFKTIHIKISDDLKGRQFGMDMRYFIIDLRRAKVISKTNSSMCKLNICIGKFFVYFPNLPLSELIMQANKKRRRYSLRCMGESTGQSTEMFITVKNEKHIQQQGSNDFYAYSLRTRIEKKKEE